MIDLKEAIALDQKDPLAKLKDRFVHQKNEIYMDGNSLGKLPKVVTQIIYHSLRNQWGERLIRSWNETWLELPLRIAKKYSQLLNTKKEEILIGESTSVRLYQIIHALIKSGLFAKQLGSDRLNFPTDLYILEGLAQDALLAPPILVDYKQEVVADLELLKTTIQNNPGIYCFSLVSYKSAFLYPMKLLNAWAEKHQSIIVWDLSHAIGAVAIDLKASRCKIALGCSYKYMNGGPGAPAFLFVEKTLQKKLFNPIQGWFGHQNPFSFESKYHPEAGINRFAIGTPPILSMQAMEAGIDLVLEAGIKNIRSKSEQLCQFFLKGVTSNLLSLGFGLESPSEISNRGANITLSHSASWQICKALINGNSKEGLIIIPDFRPPSFIRFGIAPLYTGFEDLYKVICRLEEIVLSKEYLQFDDKKPKVT